MDNTTRLYEQLKQYIGNTEHPLSDIEKLYNKFQTIFDLKEIAEFKNAMGAEPYTPSQFVHLASSMKRSFIEGYLLAQIEQKRKDIRDVYNMYKQEQECQKIETKKESKTSS
jgi:hypothetical protein